MMVDRSCPAAYTRGGRDDQAALGRQRDAVAEGSGQRGSPAPVVDAEDDAGLAADRPGPAVLDAREDWSVLARARLEALSGLFPDWRIWLDQAGWHARRRQANYLQVCHDGAPAYAVHADSPTALAAHLCWQQAADEHAPDGCLARRR